MQKRAELAQNEQGGLIVKIQPARKLNHILRLGSLNILCYRNSKALVIIANLTKFSFCLLFLMLLLSLTSFRKLILQSVRIGTSWPHRCFQAKINVLMFALIYMYVFIPVTL